MIPLKDDIPSRTFPFITIMLIIINSLIFLFEISLSQGELMELFEYFGVIPARFLALISVQKFLDPSQFYTLFTSMFLHGGWFHIIGNMWYLWIFGDNVEDRMGHFRYLIFYILCGIGAGLTHIYLNPTSTVPTIGASGAISGVMGAYFILYPRARVLTLVPVFIFVEILVIPAFFYLGFWVFMQFIEGTLLFLVPSNAGGVAVWAHFGGFILGAIFVFFFRKPKHRVPRTYVDQYFPW